MGRQEYLTRLALGRSAFLEPDLDPGLPDSILEHPGPPQYNNALSPSDQQRVQQYDSKGRPVNADAQARNAEMRRAQNSILALVGVVESRDRAEQAEEVKSRIIREHQQKVRRVEQDRGEDLELLVTLTAPLFFSSVDCLLQRFQIGFYDARTPFLETLMVEWRNLLSGGLRGAYMTLFPGAVAYIAYAAARTCVALAVEAAVDCASEHLYRPYLSRKTQKRLDKLLRCATFGLLFIADAALLPLGYYATAQQLGLAPACPLLPSLTSLVPWHPTSPHAFIWKPLTGMPLIRFLCSPAVLLMTFKALEGNTESELSLASGFTSFQYPPVETMPHMPDRPLITRDPLGWGLYQAYCLRMKALQWCSWGGVPTSAQRSDALHEKVVPSLEGEAGVMLKPSQTRRSTALASLPASFLATTIDTSLETLLLLPLGSLMLRAVAASYLSSTLPKTPQALAVGPMLYAPFGGALASLLRSPDTAGVELAHYFSKIGLSFALRALINATVFAGVYRVVRWQGRRYFDWGSKASTVD